MKKRVIKMSILMVAALMPLHSSGKPAKRGIFTVLQSDQTEVRVRLAGDEFFHQYFTEDGYPVFERDGDFYYGDIDSSGNTVVSALRVHDIESRGDVERDYLARVDRSGLEGRLRKCAAKSDGRRNEPDRVAPAARQTPEQTNDGPPYERGYGLYPTQRFPAYGDQKAIVILVEYQDVKFSRGYDAHDYFSRMLNEDGFSDYGGTGSAAEYFRDNSGGSFRPVFDVFGPVTLSNVRSWYGSIRQYQTARLR